MPTAGSATIGLAIMTYNEAPDLPNLLVSVEGAFDQIALVDNANPGSDDGTVDIFREWCERTGQRHVIDSFEWNDNASRKRTYTDSLLTTDWKCWADCDDTIIGARNLRALAAEAPAELAGYFFDYDYIYDDNDEMAGTITRERLIRKGSGTWVGRAHECQHVDGATLDIDRTIARWVHRPPTEPELQASEERDRRVFEEWAREEPDHPWVVTHQHHEAVRRLIDAQDAMSEAVQAVAATAARAHILLGRR